MINQDQKPLWHDALIAFGRMSGWIGAPILGALFIGKWLDTRFHTAPLIFISLTGLAFIISMIGLVKEGKHYLKQVEDAVCKDKNQLK